MRLDPSRVAQAKPFWAAFGEGVRPPDPLSVSAWAEKHRHVAAESGSAYPGRWRNRLVPYLAEVLDTLGLDDPTETVVFMKSAQVGGTECGVNLFGWMVQQEPGPILIVLPTIDEAHKYNKVKLTPAIEASPELRARVLEQVSRDEKSSTALFKRFRGGFAVVTGANSSTGLQMISARVLIFEEVSEYPQDTGGRGEPTAQALARSKTFTMRGRKVFYNSTPAIVGQCRITDEFERSDQRRFYVPCPSCGHYQHLTWPRLRWRNDSAPHASYFECVANGCVIEADQKAATVAAGTWIKTYPGPTAPPESFPPEDLIRHRERGSDGRSAGFAIWQAYSPFVPWDATVAEYHAALGDARKLKVFTQQALGMAWEERGDAPDHERLMDRRQTWPTRRLPPGVLFTTMAVDVQKDRLEWAVYGWGRKLASWLIEAGVIAGDSEADAAWERLSERITATYADAWGRDWPIDVVGIDAGYLSQRVYRYVRSWAHTGRVLALDGRPGWKLPAIGSPKVVDVDHQGRKIGAVQLWPVGTWDLKSETYAALRATLQGPDADGVWPVGAMHFPTTVDANFFQQLTAEALIDRRTRSGYTTKEWTKARDRNEQLDLAVYARALARRETEGLTDARWAALEAARQGAMDAAQADFADLIRSAPMAAPAAPSPAPVPMGTPMPMPSMAAAGEPARVPVPRQRGGMPGLVLRPRALRAGMGAGW